MAGAVALLVALLPSPASGSMPGENGEILVNGAVDGERGLYLLDLDGVSLTRLPIEATYDLVINYAAWSPTGSHIAFVRADQQQRDHRLWVYEMESGATTLLRSAPPGVHYEDLSWSPVGNEIAVGTTHRVDGSWSAGLLRIKSDGSLIKEISLSASFATRVEWSPTGSEILLGLAWEVPGREEVKRICLLAVGSDEPECIVEDGWWPSWSPEAERIAFGAFPSGTLTIVDRAGAFIEEFSLSYGRQSTWSPDGRFIAYPAYVGEQELGQYSIEILEFGTLDRQAYLAGIGNVFDIAWRPISPDSGFLDVSNSSVFSGDIAWLGSTGLTRGCNPPLQTHFCPDQPVTRGQLAAFLHRALGDNLTPAQPAVEFTDTGGSVFEGDIAWLSSTGVTKGCNPPDNTMFCPDEPVTRGQMAAFLARSMGYTAGEGSDLFGDDDGSIFESQIDRLATAGVARGCDPPANERFCPDDPVTRGQLAAFLRRVIGDS